MMSSHSPVNHLCTITRLQTDLRRSQSLRSPPVCSSVPYSVQLCCSLKLIFEAVLETSPFSFPRQFSGHQHRREHNLHQTLIKLITSKSKLPTSPSGVPYETVRSLKSVKTLMISELVWARSHQHYNCEGLDQN